MYKEMYDRWLAADLADADLKPELESVKDDDAAIQDRFAVALKFGTAGLRGVIGAGTNRMNIYVVRQATQGLANWVKTQGGSQTVAISYDSRIKSDVFAKTAAEVLAANGIKVLNFRKFLYGVIVNLRLFVFHDFLRTAQPRALAKDMFYVFCHNHLFLDQELC